MVTLHYAVNLEDGNQTTPQMINLEEDQRFNKSLNLYLV